jgi:hypothetical protein
MAIEYRKGPMRYAELWFDEPVDSVDADVVICHQRSAPLEGASCEPFSTRVINLTVDEEEIYRGFTSEARRNIRKAQTQDQLEYQLWMPGQWDQGVLNSFGDFYHAFARSKCLPDIQPEYLSAWDASASVAISRIRCGDADLVWFTHVILSDTARFLYAGSFYRGLSSDLKQKMARANKFLHWSLIRAFKEFGCKTYDLGGWYEGSEDLEKVRINQFKKEFGGQVVTQFDCVKALTPKGHIKLALSGFRDRIRGPLGMGRG